MQSAFVVHAEPKVDAALVPELEPLALPLLDPELPPLLEPLELLDALPELLPLEPLDDEPPELLDALPEELPLLEEDVLPPPLPEELLPLEEVLALDDPPLLPDPAGTPGEVWPAGDWFVGAPPPPPPVSSELHAQRPMARAAIAAAVGPVEVRRIMWGPNASPGPRTPTPLSLHPSSVAACFARNDVPVSHARDFVVVGAWRALDRSYLQKPFGVHIPVVGGFGQSVLD